VENKKYGILKKTIFIVGYNDNKIINKSENLCNGDDSALIQFPIPFKVPPDPYVFDYGQGEYVYKCMYACFCVCMYIYIYIQSAS
jgi:hypothetical protein